MMNGRMSNAEAPLTKAPAILLERPSPSVALIRFNRPPRNVMSPELMAGVTEALAAARADRTIRALVLTGEGDHFCAGADLGSGELPGVPMSLGGPPGEAERLRAVYAAFLALVDLPLPTVAAVNGAAVGGGLGLAAVCDFRVCTPESRFLAPFVKLGVHPGMALTETLPALVGLARAKAMLMLGDAVSGRVAETWGLAYRCVPAAELLAEAIGLAERLAAGAPAVVRWTKAAIHRAISLDVHRTADTEALAQALTFGAADAEEGLAAFREKRSPNFRGR